MIQIKTAGEIERMRQAGQAVAETLEGMRGMVRPGLTTRELDRFAEETLRARGIGRQLIEAVYREADARRCARTYWMTQEFNYRARGLYDQMATKSPFVQYRR